jgi:hypothetical protein
MSAAATRGREFGTQLLDDVRQRVAVERCQRGSPPPRGGGDLGAGELGEISR